MPNFSDYSRFRWCGKPNPYGKDTGPWQRTEVARKNSGKVVGAFAQAASRHPAFAGRDPRNTLATLVGKRLIEIEGYKGRAVQEEMEKRYSALHDICEEMQPITVRGAFYQATVRGLVEKTQAGYNIVQRALAKMRRDEDLPWDWIIDNTRDRSKPYVHANVRAALEDAADTYRKDLWKGADSYVEIWLEKDALAGVLEPITMKYDVSLMVARGFSSITFLHDAAEVIEYKACPVYVYHLGDSDSSGKEASESIEGFLREYAPNADIHYTQLAVTPEQIERWNLPTRFDKKTGERDAVELDAIDPRELRRLVERAIQKHMPKKRYEELMRQQAREQEQIRELIDQITDELGDEDNGDDPE